MQVNGKLKVHWINLKKGLQLLIVYRTIRRKQRKLIKNVICTKVGKKDIVNSV